MSATADPVAIFSQLALGAALVSCALTVSAQDAGVLQEVVVTASKRGAQNIQDVPLSIHAMTKAEMVEENVLEFNDYFRKVPGLAVRDNGPGDQRFIIRGVNTSGAAAVGVYFDEIVITDENADNGGGRQVDVKLYDVDRVEILRGPQGTTFGSSSMSGTIRIVPTAPVLDEFSIAAGAGVQSVEESDSLGWRADGAINIPLVSDRLAVRFAGIKVDNPGYIDTRFAKDDNNDDALAYRGMLAWQATDALQVSAIAMRQERSTHSRPFYNERDLILPGTSHVGAPLSGFQNANLSRAGFDDDADMFNLKAVYTTGFGAITATSSKYNRDSVFDRDSSLAVQNLSGGTLLGDGAGRSIISQFKKRDLFSNELRFASAFSGKTQLLAGVFYQEEERSLDTTIFTTDPVTGLRQPNATILFGRGSMAEITETAIFSEVAYELTDSLILTAGGRWAQFDIDVQDNASINFGGAPGPGPGPALSISDSKPTFKLNLSYSPTSRLMTYVQAVQGFRSGGANNTTAGALVGVEIPDKFESDDLVNYEVGLKSSWLGGTTVANVAVYYIDWSNIQTSQSARSSAGVTVPYLGNAGAAAIQGLELEFSTRIAEHLSLGFNGSVSKAEFTEDFPDPTQGRDGDRIPNVPRYTVNLDAKYERELGQLGLTGFIGGEWSYFSDQVTQNRPTNINYREIPASSTFNLRTGIRGADWSAILAVQNLLNEDEIVAYVFDYGGPGQLNNPDGLVRAWPRTVSLNFRKSFAL